MRTPPVALPPPIPCTASQVSSPHGTGSFWSVGFRDGSTNFDVPSGWPTTSAHNGLGRGVPLIDSSFGGLALPNNGTLDVSPTIQPSITTYIPNGTSPGSSELESGRSSAHSALLKASVSSQAEHQKLRHMRDALYNENKQLQELVSRWQRAYEQLQQEHLEMCACVRETTDKQLEQLQAEKKFHLGELHKIQTENLALKQENAALQDREKRLMEHSAAVYKHNEKLRELLLHTRDIVSSQETPPSTYRGSKTPPTNFRALPTDELGMDISSHDNSIATYPNGTASNTSLSPHARSANANIDMERQLQIDFEKEAIEALPALAHQKYLNDKAHKVIAASQLQLRDMAQLPFSKSVSSLGTNGMGMNKSVRSTIDELLKDLASHDEALQSATKMYRQST